MIYLNIGTLIGGNFGMNFKDKSVNIDTTTRCTLECPKCQRQYLRKRNKRIPGQDISFDDLLKLTKYFKRGVNFCGQMSDPIFHPDFIDMLKYCYKNNIGVRIATAASHKKSSWYKEAFLANKNAKWVFGIDGLPKDSHKYRINQDGVHLFEMMKRAKNLGLFVIWQYIVFKYNENDVEKCREMAKDNNIIFDLNMSGRWKNDDKYKPLNPKYYLNSKREEFYRNLK
jgi:MoaA/NifB/PqqE/SkfB family radical SAM enzyme